MNSSDCSGSEAGKAPIVFYFDFSSPYAYLAAHKIDDIARLYGRGVDWRPTLLGPIFKMNGNQPLLNQPLKGDYSRRDMERCARLMGVPLRLPEPFPFLSVAAARAVYWLKDRDEAKARDLSLALFNAAFQDGREIAKSDTVIEVAAERGMDAGAVRAAIDDPAVKERLKQEVDASIAAGVCGAPFFVVDGEPFWGCDRLDHVERWLSTGGW